MRRPGSIFAALVVAGALGSSGAEAATTIGSNLSASPTGSIAGTPGTAVSTSLPAGSIAGGGLSAPAAGVITGWAMRSSGASAAGNTVALRLLLGNTAVSTGRTRPAPAGAGITAYPERLPIAAAQLVGVSVDTTGAAISIPTVAASAGASASSWTAPFPDGQSRPPDDVFPNAELLLQATIEPDGDGDGFGDETQDGCVDTAGTRGGCPEPSTAPETVIDSGPKRKIGRPKAKFRFSSPSANASFECALDQGGFRDCSSPKKLKQLDDGKHRFRVRAVSAEGLIDRTPAKQGFKVKRK